jgi:Tfp pilus assembly protein PilO
VATKSATKQNLSNNNFIILALLITLVVVGITVLVGKGLVSTIILDTKVIAKKNTANNQLASNLKSAPQLVDAYNQLVDTKKTIADALPNTSDFPGLIAQLENMAGATGVSLKSIAPDTSVTATTVTTPSDSPQPQEYKVALTTLGDYASLQKFLAAVENSVRPMKVTALQIGGSGSELTTSLSISAYYQDIATIPYKLEVVK